MPSLIIETLVVPLIIEPHIAEVPVVLLAIIEAPAVPLIVELLIIAKPVVPLLGVVAQVVPLVLGPHIIEVPIVPLRILGARVVPLIIKTLIVEKPVVPLLIIEALVVPLLIIGAEMNHNFATEMSHNFATEMSPNLAHTSVVVTKMPISPTTWSNVANWKPSVQRRSPCPRHHSCRSLHAYRQSSHQLPAWGNRGTSACSGRHCRTLIS